MFQIEYHVIFKLNIVRFTRDSVLFTIKNSDYCFGNSSLQFINSVLYRHSVEVGSRRCSGCNRIRYFRCVCCIYLHLIHTHPEFYASDVLDFSMQPLSHLRTAVINENGSILIHIDKRTRLVQKCRCKRDTEFHRRYCHTFFLKLMQCVKLIDFFTPPFIFRRFHQLLIDGKQPVILNDFAVMGNIIGIHSVKILIANLSRVFFQIAGNAIYDSFDSRHSLRTTEAAHRGIGRKVSFPYFTGNLEIRNKIGIIGVKHCAL